jgi:hypothetical protein
MKFSASQENQALVQSCGEWQAKTRQLLLPAAA